MEQYAIRGGRPLLGEVSVSGAKNAALGILAAAVMANEDVIVRNLPDVSDVRTLLAAIKGTGAKVEMLNEHDVMLNGASITGYIVDDSFIRQMRAGYYLLGALLGKYHYAEVAMPGGCTIGSRPIDQHLKGFEALGAHTRVENSMICVDAETLTGAHIYFDGVSVGATINVMMAATLATGRTVLENVAKEPHVVDVANFLNTCGANIRGAGTNIIKIRGVPRLHGCTYSIIPDQIEAGTFMVAAAATHGEITVRNIIPKHQEALTAKLEEINVGVQEGSDWIRIFDKGALKPTTIKTAAYPGFPTDMQPQIVTLLTCADGSSNVTETIWNSRFSYISDLNRMGANIRISERTAVIEGCPALAGTTIKAPDLRAGAAFVIAALAANGTSIVYGTNYIDRGYYNFEGKLAGLGADIIREEVDEEEI